MTDREIVQGCIDNNRKAQEMLYRQHFAAMYAMCYQRCGNKERSLEIVNNGFLKVFMNIQSFQFNGSFQGWIRRIIWHALADYFKHEKKYYSTIVLEDYDAAIDYSEPSLQKMYADDLHKIIDTLPLATKQVFNLYVVEGYTHNEIATMVNISEGTSKWHLNNARTKLKIVLKNNRA